MHAQGMHHAWARLFLFRLLSWLVWTAATPVVLRLGRRLPVRAPMAALSILAHLAACLAIGLMSALWTALLETSLDPWAQPSASSSFEHLWTGYFFGGLLAALILYATILVVGYGLASRERLARRDTEAARLGEQLAKAQFDALRQQIEPHFLFNSLNAVAGLVREGRTSAAIGMIAGVSDLLRRVLDGSGRQLVPLGEELGFLQKYLDIQKMRFGERLQILVEVPDGLLSALVPGMILQPLAENAFKHGLSQRAQGGLIHVAVSREGDWLWLRIYNDGPPLAPESTGIGQGIGLSNSTQRLNGLYGDRFSLRLRNRSNGVEACLQLPFAPG